MTLSILTNSLYQSQLVVLQPMPERQRFVAVGIAIAVALLVFELVRRRKLREEYSWVWILTAIAVAILALNQSLLQTLSSWIGAANSVSTLFFGALVFLMALAVQFSVRLSRLTHRQRTLAQRLALLEEEVREFRRSATHAAIPSKAKNNESARGQGDVA
ncbi:MAG: DUF2304 domain-containing protein [Planctomycetota bacterium]